LIPGSKYCDELIPGSIEINLIPGLIAIESIRSRLIGHGIELIDRDYDWFDPGKITIESILGSTAISIGLIPGSIAIESILELIAINSITGSIAIDLFLGSRISRSI